MAVSVVAGMALTSKIQDCRRQIWHWDIFDVFALSARGEYWRERWGAVVDGIWMDMETELVGACEIQFSDGGMHGPWIGISYGM